MAVVIPTKCEVPMCDSIPEVSFKVEGKQRLALASPRRTVMHPYAAIVQELLQIYWELQGRYKVEVS